MVKIIGYSTKENKQGDSFICLQLQGDLVFAQNQETGRFYATAKKCSMTTTFDEETAKGLIGRDIPGTIVKVPCEPYEYVVEETGEELTLSHRWEFLPEGATRPMRVVSEEAA
jgi:hypothetical protein